MTSQALTLDRALLPRAGWVADLAVITAGTGLIAFSAQVAVPLPFTPVPITGQTFAVLLVGAALGAARGGASGALYLGLGVVGLPVYADGTHGLAVVTGATGGYLVAFPLAAALTGHLAERGWDRRFSSALGAMLSGSVLIYVCGLAWLAIVLDSDLATTLELGLYPFVPGDVVKLYLAAAALPTAWQLVWRSRFTR